MNDLDQTIPHNNSTRMIWIQSVFPNSPSGWVNELHQEICMWSDIECLSACRPLFSSLQLFAHEKPKTVSHNFIISTICCHKSSLPRQRAPKYRTSQTQHHCHFLWRVITARPSRYVRSDTCQSNLAWSPSFI
jgi:hypothetical protein